MTEKKKSYAEILKELQIHLQKLESEEYDNLDMLVSDFEAGKKLIARLEGMLDDAEQKIKKASKVVPSA